MALYSSSYFIEAGVLQGSSLGPTFYSKYTHDSYLSNDLLAIKGILAFDDSYRRAFHPKIPSKRE